MPLQASVSDLEFALFAPWKLFLRQTGEYLQQYNYSNGPSLETTPSDTAFHNVTTTFWL